MKSNTTVFFELLRAGLWADVISKDSRAQGFADAVDWEKVYQLAEEQSVVGVALSGIEHSNIKPSQELLLQWIGEVQMLEQQNKAMNYFIAEIVERMREKGIYTLLVKGQGVAQCYERPLWRPSGDVDFLLSEDNYHKAKDYLLPISTSNKNEERYSQHLGMSIDPWYVEIHGSMRTGLSERVDKAVDEAQKDVFYGGSVRSWNDGKVQVFLPAPVNDVFFVFTHFIKHFYKEGMNLRQICDWSRLLWTYKDSLNQGLLGYWIRNAGLMKEWKTFAALAVKYLGMPAEAMPFYDSDDKWQRKADMICSFILDCNKKNKMNLVFAVARIFPWNTFLFLPAIIFKVNFLKIKERLSYN